MPLHMPEPASPASLDPPTLPHLPHLSHLPHLPISDEERAARVELAACYRIFAMLGWTELIFNHITLRVPGPQRSFLINPFGLRYDEITASNLVAIDIDGHPVRPGQAAINRAGFVTHSALHRHLDGAHCVMHTHTSTGCAVACLDAGLLHDSFYGAQLHGRVAYHDFEGVTVNLAEQQRLLASIGDKPAVILRNHGLLAWGGTLAQAFFWLWTLQRACDIQIACAAAGPVRRLGPAVLAQTRREAGPTEAIVCEMVYASLRRKVDQIDQGYQA